MSYRTLVMQRPGVVTVAAERPTDSAVRPFFNASKHPAAIACGARIVDLNNAARDREDVFARYALLTTPTAKVVVPDPSQPLHVDVEPSAPSTTPTDEEPMTTEADLCGRCKKHPAAGITRTTPKGTEEWCAHCRRIESARRSGNRIGGDRVSQSAKAAKTPARKPAPKAAEPEAPQSADPMAPLRDALDRLVARGVDEDRVRAIVREELRALLARPS